MRRHNLTEIFTFSNMSVLPPTYLPTYLPTHLQKEENNVLNSVTRLGDFIEFLTTLFLFKVAQIFSIFSSTFLKWLLFGQLLENNLGYF